jgi:hypothetical protein
MIRKHFRLRRIVLGLAFAALVVPVAQAKPLYGHGGTTPTMAELEAQAAAYQSQSQQIVRSGHGGTTPTMAQLEAQAVEYQRQQVEGLRWQAMADAYQSQSPVRSENSFGAPGPSAGGASGPIGVDLISTSPTSGFDWSDAGIGASVVFAAALMLLVAVGLGRRHRQTLASA